MNPSSNLWRSLSRATGEAGRFVGRSVMEALHKIDPDVGRHLLQTPLLGLSLLAPKTDPVLPKKDDGCRPLVFVHGLGGNRGNFLGHAAFLALLGRTRSYSVHFGDDNDVDQMARSLVTFVDRVRNVTGAPQVDLVAHSLGGVVSRLAIQEYGMEDATASLVTLGSPHLGTHAARYANTEITRQLRPDSELIRKVNEKTWPRTIKSISFWSGGDLLILPSRAAILPGSEAIDATPFTHYSYLVDPAGWRMVARCMDGPPLMSMD